MKYEIKCPKCESKFDVSNQLIKWKQELYNKVDLIVKNMLKEGEGEKNGNV